MFLGLPRARRSSFQAASSVGAGFQAALPLLLGLSDADTLSNTPGSACVCVFLRDLLDTRSRLHKRVSNRATRTAPDPLPA